MREADHLEWDLLTSKLIEFPGQQLQEICTFRPVLGCEAIYIDLESTVLQVWKFNKGRNSARCKWLHSMDG